MTQYRNSARKLSQLDSLASTTVAAPAPISTQGCSVGARASANQGDMLSTCACHLGGFLGGIILSGQLLAVFMSNTGGAWDNAKKAIEDEPSDPENNTGKGSERHKAGVVGDTIGDPLKDTAGPALNPMIKVVNMVSLLAAPVLVKYAHNTVAIWAVALLMFAAVWWSIRASKKPAEKMDVEIASISGD